MTWFVNPIRAFSNERSFLQRIHEFDEGETNVLEGRHLQHLIFDFHSGQQFLRSFRLLLFYGYKFTGAPKRHKDGVGS